jgi:two-component system nitrogen regulation response regulator GlnG
VKRVWVLDRNGSEAADLVGALPALAYNVDVWSDPAEFLAALETERPDLVVLEHGLESAEAVDVLKAIKGVERRLPVVVVAERTSSQGAIESMREGAYDYLPRETLPRALEDAARRALSPDGGMIRTIGSPGPADVSDLVALVGKTPEMVEIHKLIGQVAAIDTPVLVQGEPGTGRELVARAIHYNSNRRDRAFVPVSCSVLPEAALDLELFGRRGEGAEAIASGRFEQAHRGTIFLDDIDRLGSPAQARLLSVLERGFFETPLARHRAKVDVRVIAATGRSLVQLMKDGVFRVDLFYRLKTVSLFIPPLRERPDDIPILASHFLERAKAEMRREIDGMSPKTVDLLTSYRWPGNFRELEQVMQRAVALNRTGVLVPEDFDILEDAARTARTAEAQSPGGLSETVRAELEKLAAKGEGRIDDTVVSRVERVLAEEAVARTGGNQVKAAELLGISRNTLRKRLKEGRR